MVVNEAEHTIYGTTAERLADTTLVTAVSQKWFDTDQNVLYRSDGTYWRLPGEGSRTPEIR
ncbi:MAG: hypothetical protein WC834_00060 [Eubacteriales bacterium]